MDVRLVRIPINTVGSAYLRLAKVLLESLCEHSITTEKAKIYNLAETCEVSSGSATTQNEITDIASSHIISLIRRTHGKDCGNIDYLKGGPDKLKENVKDNLYGPFMLDNIANRFGIHFTYLGTGCFFKYAKDGPYYTHIIHLIFILG
ncbi:unnamed protein product [Bursaphelenchus okinawaensis]|uniref:Uncharacterized protein n=1 Tax=Bursaphelenchus okinawaensis TaxID=465554 RepID=A0A811JRI4_9BILA|nr:unnamed protein product [Bursaphelenchus okinawaensis]CAG9079956.1 unnamed protein product [Bursaphelenchus okinawaensis]